MSRAGPARQDGTRAASLRRNEVDQLLGYTPMDYSDTYKPHSVGVYAVRFGHLAIWPLAELGPRMGGKPVDLARLWAQFPHVLRNQLPPYQVQRGW